MGQSQIKNLFNQGMDRRKLLKTGRSFLQGQVASKKIAASYSKDKLQNQESKF